MCVYTHNLEFDGLSIQFNGADLKVHSNGADVALRVGVILQRKGQTACEEKRTGSGKPERGQSHLRQRHGEPEDGF